MIHDAQGTSPHTRTPRTRIRNPIDELNGPARIRTLRAEINSKLEEVTAAQKQLQALEIDLTGKRNPVQLYPFTMAPLEIIDAPDLSDPEKMTWLTLFRFAIDKRHAWPSEAKLANIRGISVRQLQRHLTKLQRRRYLWIELVADKHGGRFFNRYLFNVDDIRHGFDQTIRKAAGLSR